MRRDPRAVTVGAQLGGRLGPARAVRRRDLCERRTQLDRVDGDLRLDLEPRRGEREGLHEPPRHGAVAGEDVGEAGAEHQPGDGVEHPVPHRVAPPVHLAVDLADGHSAADHHVDVAVDHHLDEPAGRRCVVGAVAVDHDVDVGVDVGEHAPNHVALALTGLAADHRSGIPGERGGVVARVVVEDVDRRVGEGEAEVADHVGDGRRLVEAGDEDRDGCHAGAFRSAHWRSVGSVAGRVATSRRFLPTTRSSARSRPRLTGKP